MLFALTYIPTFAQVELTKFPALLPVYESSANAQEQLSLGRATLELAVHLSVKCGDDAGFERNFSQLKPYYTDARHLLPLSDQEPSIVSAALLRLLSQNRIADFHIALETIPTELMHDAQISQVAEIERLLMEGRYPHVLVAAHAGATSELFSPFLSTLVATVRDEIAACAEKSYPELNISDAGRLLNMKSSSEVESFCQERGWCVVAPGDTIVFASEDMESQSAAIPSLQLIHNCFTYAKELERIV